MMKTPTQKKLLTKLSFEIEEIILLTIILLNVFDALKLLSPELDYIKKIISWTALGIVLYKAKIVKLFSGQERPFLEGTLITGYFLLIIKNLLAYATGNVATTSAIMQPLYDFLSTNAPIINKVTLLAGLFLLLFVALHITFRSTIKQPSVLAMLGEKDEPVKTSMHATYRLSKAFGVIFLFFVSVFNLVMEWLAIAIDAPLLMTGLVLYLFFVVKHKEKFAPESFLAKFGNFGSNFYQDVINHFKYKKTVFRALSGLLVLHFITDAFNFVWPFVFGLQDPLYFNLLSQPHPSLFTLLQQDIARLELQNILVLGGAYLGNVLGLLALLLLPALLWVLLYKNKPLQLTRAGIAGLVSVWILMLLVPVFKIRPLLLEPIYGVDIVGQSAIHAARIPPLLAIAISVLIGLIVFVSVKRVVVEKQVTKIIIAVLQLFFLLYSALFYFSISSYYIATILATARTQQVVLCFMLCALYLCTTLFYVLATGSFLVDTTRHAQSHLQYKDLRKKRASSHKKHEYKISSRKERDSFK